MRASMCICTCVCVCLWSTEVVYVWQIEVEVTCLLSHSPSYLYRSFQNPQHLFLSTELADLLSLDSNLAQVIPHLHFLSYGITGRPSAHHPNSMCVLGIRTLVSHAGKAMKLLTELFLQSPRLLIYASFCQRKWDICQCYDIFLQQVTRKSKPKQKQIKLIQSLCPPLKSLIFLWNCTPSSGWFDLEVIGIMYCWWWPISGLMLTLRTDV